MMETRTREIRRVMTRTTKKRMMRLRMMGLHANRTFTCSVAALCAVVFIYSVD